MSASVIVERLRTFVARSCAWDSYDAQTISPVALGYATILAQIVPLAPPPHVAPGPDGGVYWYWHVDDWHYEAILAADGTIADLLSWEHHGKAMVLWEGEGVGVAALLGRVAWLALQMRALPPPVARFRSTGKRFPRRGHP